MPDSRSSKKRRRSIVPGPRELTKKRHARLMRIAGLRGETLREQQNNEAYLRMGPAFHKYIDAAAAAGCPMAMNLIAQFNNCKVVFK